MEFSLNLKKPKFSVISFLPLFVLCLCLGTTYHLWHLAYQLAKKEQQQHFDSRANEIGILIEQRLQTYTQVLYGGRGLFVASQDVSRQAFKNYLAELQIENFFPGIQGVGVSLLIPGREKQAHLDQIHAEGFVHYSIHPEGERDFYSAVVYLEPFTRRNLRDFGYDMYTEPVRRTAMDKAWQENKTIISGKVRLLQDAEKTAQVGFLMYLPLYRSGADISTPALRRVNLLGWIYATFRMNNFMQGVLEKQHKMKLDVDVDVYDGRKILPENLLYNRDSDELDYTKAVFSAVKDIEIAGHLWSLHIHSHPGFESQINLKSAYLTLMTSIAISCLLPMITWLLVSGRKRALALAQQMNAELLEREMRYRQMFEGSSSVSVLIDSENGTIIDANPAASAFWGYSIEQLRTMNIKDITTLPPTKFLSSLQTVLQQSRHLYTQDRLSNGEIREVEIYANAIVYQGRMVIHSITHDISERKHLEMLREQFFTFFRLAPDFQCIVDTDGFLKKVNPTFIETLGFGEQELLEHSFLEFVYPEDRQTSIERFNRQLLVDRKAVLNFENRYLCKDNSFRWLSWKAVFNPSDRLIYAVAHDVTHRKKQEQEIKRLSNSALNKAKLEAEKANRAKSEFLSSMSHELRTPLNAVLGFAQLLESEDLTEDQLDSVQEILNAGYHLLDLVNEVLDLSKIEAEKIELNFKAIPLNELIIRCITLLNSAAVKQHLTIVNQVTENGNFSICADELRFKQVLLNLLSNAIKYNQPGGKVTLSAQLIAENKLKINVIDTGGGLSAAQISKLFQPFERLDAKNSHIEGTGIGLCISKKLVEAMHGTIGVESVEGQGSCFWIEIPLAK